MSDATPDPRINEEAVSEESARQKMTDFIKSVIRTGVPYLTVLLVSWLRKVGIETDEATINGPLTFAIGTIWYSAARVLEQKWPKLGWLLGVPSKPIYTKKA